jgi:transcriptional regulator with XRE-family HTH domain
MSKRKPLDKELARERRDRLLATAASSRLSLTDGVRDMRAISGMTQEDFARHRGVSARVIKALELGQGNPTVATLNRIGEFFGLEVGFVPKRRPRTGTEPVETDKLLGLSLNDYQEIHAAFRNSLEKMAEFVELVETKAGGKSGKDFLAVDHASNAKGPPGKT